MTDDFSEQKIRQDCPHCDPNSFALKNKIEETKNFWVVCDVHPLERGHVLIIPKQHLSCIGEYPDEQCKEFHSLFVRYLNKLGAHYGKMASFEHGKIGQTVFHSHVHLLPFQGTSSDIVPEGLDMVKPIANLALLRDVFSREGQYLFFSIGPDMWIVRTELGAPRFFRDRFAKALGHPERGNWKEMHANQELMQEAQREIAETTRVISLT